MKIAIFGATGRTGRHLLEQALASGYTVTALTRTASKLEVQSERLKVVQGDVQEAACVEDVVVGAKAVVSVLGPPNNRPEYVVSRGVVQILNAMRRQPVTRLVLSIGAGVRDPQDAPGPIDSFFGVLVKTFSANVYEDMRRTSETVRASDVDWTIVRVPMLTDDPSTGPVRVGYVGRGVGVRLARANLAAFMLKQVQDKTYMRQAPVISN